MDLSYTEDEQRFRAELRAFLEVNVPRDEPPEDLDAEFLWMLEF